MTEPLKGVAKFNAALLKKKPEYVPDKPTVAETWDKLGSSSEQAFDEYLAAAGAVEQPADEDGNAISPVMPSNITLLSSDELGHLYGHFIAMATWLDEQATLAEARAAECDVFFDQTKAEELLTKNGTVAAKNAKATTAEHIILAEHSALVATAKAKLLRSRVRGFERCASALSREMTRRSPNSFMPA